MSSQPPHIIVSSKLPGSLQKQEISISRYGLFLRIFQTYLQSSLQTSKNVEDWLAKHKPIISYRLNRFSDEIKALDMSGVAEVLEDILSTHDIVWEHAGAVNYSKKFGIDYLYRLYALKIESLPKSEARLVGEVLAPFILILGPIDESTSLTDLYHINITTETLDFLEKELRCQR